MRAKEFYDPVVTQLAIEQLARNASLLADTIGTRLVHAVASSTVRPYLIALDSIDLDVVTSYRWSPSYASNDIHAATTFDPIIDGRSCHDRLAEKIRSHITSRGGALDVVLPNAFALKKDPIFATATDGTCCSDNRVYHVVSYCESDTVWIELFKEAQSFASNAGSFELVFCTKVLPANESGEWTAEQLDFMLDRASCMFSSALDGEGYLVWEF